MKKFTINLLLVLSSALIISACNDKDGDNDVLPAPFDESGLESNGSKIEGTSMTETSQGESVEGEFDYMRLVEYPEFTSVTPPLGQPIGSVNATLCDDLTGFNSDTRLAEITITDLSSIGQTEIPTITIDIRWTKELGNGRTFRGRSSHTNGPNNDRMIVSNYKYDSGERQISFDFSDTSADGENGEDVNFKGKVVLSDIREYQTRP